MSTLGKRMTNALALSDGMLPRAVLVPDQNHIQVAVGPNHPWASKQGLEKLMGSSAPQNPQILTWTGTQQQPNYLGLPYIQNSARPEDVQASIAQYMDNGGITQIADTMAALMGGDVQEYKRKRARGKLTTAPGIPQPTGGDGTIPENEPLSKTQMSGPKQTDYRTVASQMQQSNLNDQYTIQGGAAAQNRNIPPNYLQRDPWTGRTVRGCGYSEMQPNSYTKQLEIRHKTDMGGNMYGTVGPYASPYYA